MCVNVGQGLGEGLHYQWLIPNFPLCEQPNMLFSLGKPLKSWKRRVWAQEPYSQARLGRKDEESRNSSPTKSNQPTAELIEIFQGNKNGRRAVGLPIWSQTGFPNGFRRDNQCVYKSPMSTAPGGSVAPSLHVWARNALKSHYLNMDWPIHCLCVECSHRVREDVTHALLHRLSKLWVDSFKHLP